MKLPLNFQFMSEINSLFANLVKYGPEVPWYKSEGLNPVPFQIKMESATPEEQEILIEKQTMRTELYQLERRLAAIREMIID